MMTDPIADLLTRIRNANRIKRAHLDVPFSKVKEQIATVLKREGFIRDYKVTEVTPTKKDLRLYLKYGSDGEFVVNSIRRESRPGRRVYRGVDEIKEILHGLGISIYSTPKGLLTDRQCREQKVGGELICTIW